MRLLTALANEEQDLFHALVDELDAEQHRCAVIHLAGFVIGLLVQRGNPAELLAALGPELEARRG